MTEGHRVLVTGATGFIGRHLVRALVDGGADVTALVRPGSPRAAGPPHTATADLEDIDAIADVLHRTGARIVFHLVGKRPRGQAEPAHACVRANVATTAAVLSAVMRGRVQRVVTLGTAEEYGVYAGPQREDQPLQPRSVYGASKAAATLLARSLYLTSGCPVVVLRPFSVYGPGQRPEMFVAEAVQAAVQGKPFRMSHGTQARDFVFVGDVVTALMAAADEPSLEGQVINIGSGRATRLIDVARQVWKTSGTAAPLLVGERPTPPWELHDTWADVERARALLKWNVRTSLETGLEATIAWGKGHGD